MAGAKFEPMQPVKVTNYAQPIYGHIVRRCHINCKFWYVRSDKWGKKAKRVKEKFIEAV